ncbi:MAG: hypothetical protein O3C65_14585 [Proteobacteria bacterium]|nr:hypothetical protein [Pseudomonadota bacterium]MDA1059901.1 hypothetical protein [Pseudomonadota bacterium]
MAVMEAEDSRVKHSPVKLAPASPHGALEEVLPGIWFVRGGIKMPIKIPMKISRSMTVVKDADGGLTLFNSMRLSEAGLAALEALGTVKNVMRIAGFHGRDDAFYRDRYGAKVYAIAGQRYTRGMEGDPAKTVDYMQPDVWLSADDALPIDGASLKILSSSTPPEAICRLDRDGGILIAGDSLQHTPVPDEFFNFPAKIMMKKMGFFKPYNVGPGWLQFAHPSAAEVRSILDLDFEHVLPGHGTAVIGGAKEKFRIAIEGELKGCHV